MVGHRISFSDNLQKLKFRGHFLCALCVAMVTDMTSQVLLKYSPTIELQGDIFLIWDGLGVGGGRGGQLPKKTPAQRKSAKKYNAKCFTQKKQGAN